MLVDASIYNERDINAQFSGGYLLYKGVPSFVHGATGNVVHLSPIGGGDVNVKFGDKNISNRWPATGAYQAGLFVEVLNMEPVRQWKKVFRTRDCTITRSPFSNFIYNHMTENDRVMSLFGKREFSYQEALEKILSGSVLQHVINRQYFLSVSRTGKSVQLYNISSLDTPVGTATSQGVTLFDGASDYKDTVAKFVEVLNV